MSSRTDPHLWRRLGDPKVKGRAARIAVELVRDLELTALYPRSERDRERRGLRQVALDRCRHLGARAADELFATVHHHLRRVHLTAAQPIGVESLTLGVVRVGEGIAPAE